MMDSFCEENDMGEFLSQLPWEIDMTPQNQRKQRLTETEKVELYNAYRKVRKVWAWGMRGFFAKVRSVEGGPVLCQ